MSRPARAVFARGDDFDGLSDARAFGKDIMIEVERPRVASPLNVVRARARIDEARDGPSMTLLRLEAKPGSVRNMIKIKILPSVSVACVALLTTALLAGCGDDTDMGTSGGSTSSSSSSGGAQVMTIADARALADGSSATVEGYVTVAPGTFNSAVGDQGFVIQDETAGVYVGIADLLTFPLDQKVRVTGKLSQVAQQTVLAASKADVSEVAGMTKTIMPVDTKTGDVKEPVEGKLIRVAGKVTQAVMDDSPYGMKVYINDGSGEIQVFVHLVGGKTIIDTSMLMIDQPITVVGVGAQYEATYEVTPRKADDLTP